MPRFLLLRDSSPARGKARKPTTGLVRFITSAVMPLLLLGVFSIGRSSGAKQGVRMAGQCRLTCNAGGRGRGEWAHPPPPRGGAPPRAGVARPAGGLPPPPHRTRRPPRAAVPPSTSPARAAPTGASSPSTLPVNRSE